MVLDIQGRRDRLETPETLVLQDSLVIGVRSVLLDHLDDLDHVVHLEHQELVVQAHQLFQGDLDLLDLLDSVESPVYQVTGAQQVIWSV